MIINKARILAVTKKAVVGSLIIAAAFSLGWQANSKDGSSLSLQDALNLVQAETANAAAVDYFLKIDGIDGESSDDKHKNEIDILSFSWGKDAPGVENGGTSAGRGGAGAGKVSMQDIHFTASVSKASPQLMLACAQGKHIKEAKLFVRKTGGGQQDFIEIKLQDVLISSYQTGGSQGTVPTDSFSLNYSKIEFEYRPQRADGSTGAPVKAGWDLKQNKSI